MKLIFQISIFFFSFFSFSQEAFEPGFYIDNKGNQIEGFINNENWFNAPDFIFFKVNETSKVERLDIQNVRLFEINNALRYERYTLQVDTKPNSIYKESGNSNSDPVYTLKTVFLKVLVKGEADLLQYIYSGNSYYYCKIDKNEKIIPLVYKKYIDSNGNERENVSFRKVLFENLHCDTEGIDRFLKIKYIAKSLIEVFEDFNKCGNASHKIYKEEKKKSKFNVTAFLGYGFSSYKTGSSYSSESASSPVFGAELSLVLPHKNYRYELFSRIYHEDVNVENFSNKISTGNPSSYFLDEIKSDFTIIAVSIGTRYNFFIDEGKNKLFLDASLGTNFISGGITYKRNRFTSSGVEFVNDDNLITRSSLLLNVGFGYVFNDTLGIDFRYDLFYSSNLVTNPYGVENNKNAITASLRYTFL